MNRLLILVVALVTAVALADRVIVFSSAKSRTYLVEARLLADGGCSAVACGEANSADGGNSYQSCTPGVALSGPALTRCLNLLNSGDALWRAQEKVP